MQESLDFENFRKYLHEKMEAGEVVSEDALRAPVSDQGHVLLGEMVDILEKYHVWLLEQIDQL